VASFKTTAIRRIIRRHPPTLRAVPVDGAERAFGTPPADAVPEGDPTSQSPISGPRAGLCDRRSATTSLCHHVATIRTWEMAVVAANSFAGKRCSVGVPHAPPHSRVD